MTRSACFGIVCAIVLTASPVWAQAPQDAAQKPPDPKAAATEAVKASPELVDALSKEIGATPEQAAGAAGALFGVAKSRLKDDEFSKVSSAVPGMDALLRAAPAASGVAGTTGGGLSQVAGQAAGLASAASAFSKLGLKPEMVSKAIPVLTSFVSKSGGANVGSLLASVLK
jgi:Protein of unknown function VcgC/VcgE (DUF2780)